MDFSRSIVRVDFNRFRKLVGANARRARWLAGLSQIETAYEVITPRLLAEIEKGLGNPTLETLHRLATKLEISVRDLVEVGDEVPLACPLRDAEAQKPRAGRKPKP